ncbi:dipeptidase [Aquibacillus salsiterrae]|uniref:Dipeptidase n=1 Tax=Aquibacillus salsiterrae TaxID=2950439 RepID=A0A9X3WDV1_9BACI|nr:dipeptidase [Aquibacillus salsiterrae]MDC3416325.1 dipeptidase [Aquibacillus salsiterrae]
MIIDAHCDALLKLWEKGVSFHDSDELQVNYIKWKKSSVKIQCFAIFVPDYVQEETQFSVALQMVDLFFEQIIKPYDDVTFISNRQDLLSLKEHEKGAILTLEGCHSIGRDINKLQTLIRLGVRAVGLTWNQANATCDGIGDSRGAGLSDFGNQVVTLLNEEKIWTDVSHISYQGFFDVMSMAHYPMASHSNAKALCGHRRNLDDKQIKTLVDKNGWIGVTYVPYFLSDSTKASVQDVLKHVSYFIAMGAENCLGLGSDFDGTDQFVAGLYDHADYDSFIQLLMKRFTIDQVEKIKYYNFVDKFPRIDG